MLQKIVKRRFSMFEVPTQDFYRKADSHFISCSLKIERNKSKDGTAIYEAIGVEGDVNAFLETIKHY